MNCNAIDAYFQLLKEHCTKQVRKVIYFDTALNMKCENEGLRGMVDSAKRQHRKKHIFCNDNIFSPRNFRYDHWLLVVDKLSIKDPLKVTDAEAAD